VAHTTKPRPCPHCVLRAGSGTKALKSMEWLWRIDGNHSVSVQSLFKAFRKRWLRGAETPGSASCAGSSHMTCWDQPRGMWPTGRPRRRPRPAPTSCTAALAVAVTVLVHSQVALFVLAHDCPAGQWSASGGPPCTLCATGLYSPAGSTSSAACVSCTTGCTAGDYGRATCPTADEAWQGDFCCVCVSISVVGPLLCCMTASARPRCGPPSASSVVAVWCSGTKPTRGSWLLRVFSECPTHMGSRPLAVSREFCIGGHLTSHGSLACCKGATSARALSPDVCYLLTMMVLGLMGSLYAGPLKLKVCVV
jgi:hypothetical protein